MVGENFSEPKKYGEILSQTFRIIKKHFSDLFLIMLIVVGPIFLIQAILQLVSGADFLRESGAGTSWFDLLNPNLEQATELHKSSSNFVGIFTNLPQLILLSVAQVAIYHLINHIRKDEPFTIGSVIKLSFSKFWPIAGSMLLFFAIAIGITIVPIIFVVFASFVGAAFSPAAGITTTIILILIVSLLIALLLIRWSFYLGVIAFGGSAPGLSESWRLTQGRTWKLLGLFITLSLITGIPTMALDMFVTYWLGNSVLYGLIINIFSIFTALVVSVGYAVIYFDLKLRQ